MRRGEFIPPFFLLRRSVAARMLFMQMQPRITSGGNRSGNYAGIGMEWLFRGAKLISLRGPAIRGPPTVAGIIRGAHYPI